MRLSHEQWVATRTRTRSRPSPSRRSLYAPPLQQVEKKPKEQLLAHGFEAAIHTLNDDVSWAGRHESLYRTRSMRQLAALARQSPSAAVN